MARAVILTADTKHETPRLDPLPTPEALPPKPQPPVDYDCCGGGCADCELRIYLRELGRWRKLARLQGIPVDD